MKNMNKGFTYIEILIVIVIMGVLLAISVNSYTHIRQNSFDQRRKTDIQEIRASLEQYRSENNAYPTPGAGSGLPFGTAGLTDSSHTYMSAIPQDPEYPQKTYYYTSSNDDYTLATQLTKAETPACQANPGSDSCGTGYDCNYCFGSYGTK